MIVVHNIPLYWGIEADAEDRTFLTKALLNEILPPFRISRWAFRIRVSHRHWLHFGWFVYQPTLRRWGIAVDPNEIGRWGRDQTEEAPEGEDEVQSAGSGASVAGDRGEPVEDSGVLLQPDEQGDRHGLVAAGDGASDRGSADGDPRASRTEG